MNDSEANPLTGNQSSPSCSTDATATCCANFYEQDLVQELMGGSYHPGGENLSHTLVEKLELPAGSSILDVACGVGTTSRMMAAEFGLEVTGLDFSAINVSKATALFAKCAAGDEAQSPPDSSGLTSMVLNNAASQTDEPCCGPGESCCPPTEPAQGTTDQVQSGDANFVQGSAVDLPFDDRSFDGLTCECAVSTFANQPKVAREFFRVLKPGGVFGMTDMVVNGDLPADFSEKVAPWTCMAKALTADGYRELFAKEGFEFVQFKDFSHTLLELATDMKRKLVMAGMGKAIGALPSMSEAMGMSLAEMRQLLATSTELVRAGTIQYGLLLFRTTGE